MAPRTRHVYYWQGSAPVVRSKETMPSFARELEQTLHNALSATSGRRHEYATLDHLLLPLIADEHASKIMTACGIDLS